MKVIVTAISDTHTKHNQVFKDLHKGHLLIHGGDFMNSGYEVNEAYEFFDSLDSVKGYDHKFLIAGNHDRVMEINNEKMVALLNHFPSITYLQDESAYIADLGVKIYGSPWQPEFFNWAFNLPKNGKELQEKWDAIPEDTDILITHGPPFGYLGIPGGQSIRTGCEILRDRVDKIKPKIHIFGHIHGSAGYHFNGHTHFINAAVLNERYVYTNLPQTFEWDTETNEIKWI